MNSAKESRGRKAMTIRRKTITLSSSGQVSYNSKRNATKTKVFQRKRERRRKISPQLTHSSTQEWRAGSKEQVHKQARGKPSRSSHESIPSFSQSGSQFRILFHMGQTKIRRRRSSHGNPSLRHGPIETDARSDATTYVWSSYETPLQPSRHSRSSEV